MTETIQVPAACRAALLDTASYDEAENTIDVVWTTGSDWPRYDVDVGPGGFIERLATNPENVRLGRLNIGGAFLDTHQTSSTASFLGKVVPGSARMVDGKGLCKVRLSRSERARDTVQDIKDGIISAISVGYIIHQYLRSESPEGRTIMTAVDWEPTEISAVPVPVDPGAGIGSAFRSASSADINTCSIIRAASTNEEKEAVVAEDKSPNEKPEDETRDADVADAAASTETAAGPDEAADALAAVDLIPEEEIDQESIEVADDLIADVRSYSKAEIEAIKVRAIEADRTRMSEIRSMAGMFEHASVRDLAEEFCRSGGSLNDYRAALIPALAAETRRSAPIVNSINEPALTEKRTFTGPIDWSKFKN